MVWILPAQMKMRMLLQELWLQPIDWDTPLNKETRDPFLQFIIELENVASVTIPRWTGYLKGTSLDLIGFSDAAGSVMQRSLT